MGICLHCLFISLWLVRNRINYSTEMLNLPPILLYHRFLSTTKNFPCQCWHISSPWQTLYQARSLTIRRSSFHASVGGGSPQLFFLLTPVATSRSWKWTDSVRLDCASAQSRVERTDFLPRVWLFGCLRSFCTWIQRCQRVAKAVTWSKLRSWGGRSSCNRFSMDW